MGGNPCRTKAILNGGTIENEVKMLCYEIQKVELSDDVGYAIVKLFNQAEDAVFKAKRVFLESQMGFDGPWPNSLK